MTPAERKSTLRERLLPWIVLGSLISAWAIGVAIIEPPTYDCRQVLPTATTCRVVRDDILEGVIEHQDGTETVVGWASVESAPGHSGPVEVLVGVNPAGEITGVAVVAHSETPMFFAHLVEQGFLESFAGEPTTSPFELGQDVQAVTRATATSAAITEAVRGASRNLAGADLARETGGGIAFGLPEITLLALYGASLIGLRPRFRYRHLLRWAALLVSLGVLGFATCRPFTVGYANALLLGYWPHWQTNLYWYLLVGGILLLVLGTGKNLYCASICPFGAAQECLAVVGRAKNRPPGRGKALLTWIPKGLAWLAIVLGLALRNPGLPSYEIFCVLFAFRGSTVQWILLAIVLVLALFVRRPWCRFLCPVPPVLLALIRVRRRFKTWIQTIVRSQA